jgi:hypothetical protein
MCEYAATKGEERDSALSSTGGYGFAELQVLSDKQLMEHVKARNYEARGVLFERYYRLILSIGFKILRNSGEAEDR